MKNSRILISTVTLFLVLVGIGMAAVPAPPVNQNLGLPDTTFPNVPVNLCRGCHPGAPDIHHFMVSGGPGSHFSRTTALGCVDCHPIIGGQLTISRNCHDCHDGTAWPLSPIVNLTKIRGAPGKPHHNTTKASASNIVNATFKAADRQCTFCHGSGYLANYNDGHYVPKYNTSMITPMATFKVNDSGKLWGGCLACHNDGVEAGLPIYNSDTTHHTVRFWVGYQCNNCHVSSGFRAEPVPDYNREPSANAYRVNFSTSYPQYVSMFGWDTTKTHFEFRNNTIMTYGKGYVSSVYPGPGDALNGTGCEKCHSVQTLHNIETASPGRNITQTLADEIPGYGHIGNNSDCNGCHQGWKGSVTNPFAGPKAMSIYSVFPGVLTADAATDITITGNGFVESPYKTTVLVDNVATAAKIADSVIVATVNLPVGVHNIVVQKDVATTVTTTVIAVKPGTIASAALSGTTIEIDGAGLGADQTMVSIVKSDGTHKASDRIISSTDTQIVAEASQAAVGDVVSVITTNGEAIATIVAGTPTPTPTPIVTPTPTPTPTPAPTNGITVTSPNGGESWKQKSTHAITWTKVGTMGANVKIELLKGTSATVIKSSTPNSGTYSWAIGTTAIGTTYKVRITSINARGQTYTIYTDSSDKVFNIKK
jgi:hypothetical protein